VAARTVGAAEWHAGRWRSMGDVGLTASLVQPHDGVASPMHMFAVLAPSGSLPVDPAPRPAVAKRASAPPAAASSVHSTPMAPRADAAAAGTGPASGSAVFYTDSVVLPRPRNHLKHL